MQRVTEDSYLKLKSGTDIRGVAVKTENEDVELTDEVVSNICLAFAYWYNQKFGKRLGVITVGHDSRISADRISAASISAFIKAGCEVYNFNLASTPAMFMSTVLEFEGKKADAALEITASHHPYQRNGLKFFTPNGGLEGSEVKEILKLAAKTADLRFENTDGTVKDYPFMEDYSAHLRNIIIKEVAGGDEPLAGLKITVDAGNGAGGFYAEKVLAPLGADISGSQFLAPDGMFPNHIPNPENKDAIKAASDMVINSNSDLGLIFDTDVDRAACVSSDGKEINRNRLVALASVIALENEPGGVVVTDSLTSDGLRDFIENKLGGKQLRFKRGYKNVIDKSIELNNSGVNSPLAIETSGHAALKENFFLDDGAYLATKIVCLLAKLKKQGRDINELISELKEPAESIEIRLPIKLNDFKEYGESVIAALTEYAESREGFEIEKENYEGVRINIEGGWFLLRLSVHDPILPLNIENDKTGVCSEIAKELKEFFAQFDKLDLSGFDKVN